MRKVKYIFYMSLGKLIDLYSVCVKDIRLYIGCSKLLLHINV